MSMETEKRTNRDIKNQIPSGSEIMSSEVEFQGTNNNLGQQGSSGLTRQPSMSKTNNCLCSPTTHAGSFRCRLHRAPSLQRTRSMEASLINDSTGDANKDQSNLHGNKSAQTNAYSRSVSSMHFVSK